MKNMWQKQFEDIISENVLGLKSDMSLQNKNFEVSTTLRKRNCKQTKRKDYYLIKEDGLTGTDFSLITIDIRKWSNSFQILRKITINHVSIYKLKQNHLQTKIRGSETVTERTTIRSKLNQKERIECKKK